MKKFVLISLCLNAYVNADYVVDADHLIEHITSMRDSAVERIIRANSTYPNDLELHQMKCIYDGGRIAAYNDVLYFLEQECEDEKIFTNSNFGNMGINDD